MPRQADLCYRYDGSLNGLLCCVFESYARDEMPALIATAGGEQVSLFPVRTIATQPQLARRVSMAIHQKISPEALLLVRLSHLTCLENRESHILRFVRLGFAEGARVTGLVSDSRVDVLIKAVNHLKAEQHNFKGFLRFSDMGGVLVAEIMPKNFVLPLIASHFAGRFSGETFMVYDRTHKAALLHSGGQKEIIRLDAFTPPPPDPEERRYRRLWKNFYDTIAIESRTNHRCRMGHMPKRYWSTMTELMETAAPVAPAGLPPPMSTSAATRPEVLPVMTNGK